MKSEIPVTKTETIRTNEEWAFDAVRAWNNEVYIFITKEDFEIIDTEKVLIIKRKV
jgi:hypothetical protein